jgi:hypothetical protein
MLADAIYGLEVFLHRNSKSSALKSPHRRRLEIVVAGWAKTVSDPWFGDDVGRLLG